MAASNRKTSRSLQNQPRQLGIIRPSQDSSNSNNKRFSIAGYSKQIIPNNSPSNNPNENLPTKKLSSASNTITHSTENSIQLDHTDCLKSINELKEINQNLTKDISILESDLRKSMWELTNFKSEIDRLKQEKSVLQVEKTELENDNSILKNNYTILSDEFVQTREEWKVEKERLEKSLNEIRKELENKIIEIRAKHSQEVLAYEEKVDTQQPVASGTELLATLSRISNIVYVLQEAKVPIHVVDQYLIGSELTASDMNIEISENKSAPNWNITKSNVSSVVNGVIRQKIGEKGKVAQHYNLSNEQLKHLSDHIAEEVIKQIKVRYDFQGKWEWMTQGRISDSFFYNNAIKYKDNSLIEYIDTGGTGTIMLDQKIRGSDMIYLKLKLHIIAVTMDISLIEYKHNLVVGTLNKELKWK